jgi:predicted CXXCH cytochrome family protein
MHVSLGNTVRYLTVISVTFALSGVCSSVFAEAPSYVGSGACVDCHNEVAEAWSGSHHAKAWTTPNSENVLADFDGTEFAHDGTLTRFRIENGTYFATVTEKDGSTRDYPIHSVAGIAPLQQYLLETEPGRLQSFDVVWDTKNRRWYHLYPDQDLPPEDGLHWTGPYKNWNGRCAECHATGFQKNYNLGSRTYASTQAEIGVGCEACHGPGSAHLEWASERSMISPPEGLDRYGFTMTFGQSVAADMEQCAGCHARREAFGQGNPLPGTAFADAYNLALLRPSLYHADGQIREEVYVYGSFLQSKMYAKGVGCNDCHDAHEANLVAEGNALCTQCHSAAGNPRFPTLKLAEYDTPAHHFHVPDTDGAQCKNCHMIERFYMGVDGRRDHSFRVPRPDISSTIGAPNACTDCHADRDAKWAATELASRFPTSHHRGSHFAQTLSVGRIDPGLFAGDLLEIAEHTGLPAIVRASALDLLTQASDPVTLARIRRLLSDDDPVVRVASISVFDTDDHITRAQVLAPLLQDPVKSVRIAAARQFLAIPIDQLASDTAESASRAMSEWQASLLAKVDFPETQLVLGGIALATRNLQSAEAAFREAVRLDPQIVDAWLMTIRIRLALGDINGAQSIVSKALAANPDDEILLDFERQLK